MHFRSARQALVFALANGWHRAGDGMEMARIGTKVQFSEVNRSLGKIACGLECGQVLAALDKSGAIPRQWGIFAYGPDAGRQIRHTLANYVSRQYIDSHIAKAADPLRPCQLLHLIPDILDDYAVLQSCGRRRHSVSHWQDRLGLTRGQRNNWARDYGPQWKDLECVIDGLDRKALAPVAALLRVIEERNTEA